MPGKVELLDCTLRDAGYPIKFQFTIEDCILVALGLEQAGIRRIEVGHGLGLGASNAQHGWAAASDEEYLAAMSGVLTEAAFGVFAIPGIATLEHLQVAVRHRVGFVRLGVDADRTEELEPFIKEGVNLGLSMSVNLMKSYILSEEELLRRVQRLVPWGVEVVSVVDSAGGMLPRETGRYVARLAQETGVRIGFHGHNNLQLAIANSLAAVQAGASVVDVTLRGMGRSSGNAQTDVLAMILEREGYQTGVNPFQIMDLSDQLIRPFARERGVDPLDVVLGYAQFHSGYLERVRRVAERHSVDLRLLVIRLAEISKASLDEAILEREARNLASTPVAQPGLIPLPALLPADFAIPVTRRVGGFAEEAGRIASELFAYATKLGRQSVFAIARSGTPREDGSVRFPYIRMNEKFIVGNAELRTLQQAREIVAAVDGKVDLILVDGSCPARGEGEEWVPTLRGAASGSRLLAYQDQASHILAAESLIRRFLPEQGKGVLGVCGLDALGVELARRFARPGGTVLLWDADRSHQEQVITTLRDYSRLADGDDPTDRVRALLPGEGPVDVLVGARIRTPVIPAALVDCLKAGGTVIDAGIGTLSAEALACCVDRQIPVIRVDPSPGLFAELELLLTTGRILTEAFGAGQMEGVPVVAGGMIGERGAVVIDSLRAPTRVIGIADGRGGILDEEEAAAHAEAVHRVREEILRRRFRGFHATTTAAGG